MLRGIAILALISTAALARNDGRYDNSPLHKWVDSLRSEGGGPCCSTSDGIVIEDADWESKDGHYRVYINKIWIDVPDDRVIKEPNLMGRTMVWPATSSFGIQTVRCFLPGSMT